MKKIKSKLEIQTIKVIERCTDLWLLIYATFTGIIILFGSSDKMSQLFVLIVGLVFGIVIFFLGKEYIIQLTMKSINAFSDIESEICGLWEIRIDYAEESKKTGRRGTVLLEKSASGLILRGSKIYDRNTPTVVVEEWISDYVEIIDIGSELILQYAFRLRRPKDKPDEFRKVGHVILKSTDEKRNFSVFEGEYIDLSLLPLEVMPEDLKKEKLRQGRVILRRAGAN